MTAEWRGPFWLKPFFAKSSDTIFHRVTSVQLGQREVPSALLKLRYLESVSLQACQVSTQQLRSLNALRSLKSLSLHANYVAADAVIQAGKRAPGAAAEQMNQPPAWACRGGSTDVAFVCPSDSSSEPSLE